MARYRIVCTTQEPLTAPVSHQHIVAVGTGSDPDKADARWTLQQVLDAMDKRPPDTFYTQGKESGKVAEVISVNCPHCGRRIIRSAPDAVKDNNLDNLRRCNWTS